MLNPERNQESEDLVILIYADTGKSLAPVPSDKFLVKLEKKGIKDKNVRWKGTRQMGQKLERWNGELLRNY